MPAPAFGAEFLVNQITTGAQVGPNFTVLPDGRMLFTWYGENIDGNSYGVGARVCTIQSDGSIVWGAGGEFALATRGTNAQVTPVATVLADGRVLFTWTSSDSSVDGSSSGIAGRIGTIQANGSIVWGAAGEFTINEEGTNTQQDAQALLLADGRILVTWSGSDLDVDGSGYGISGRIGTVQANGSITWASAGEVTLNEEVTGTQARPQVLTLPDGRLLFTWDSADADVNGSNQGITTRIGTVQADGSFVWASAGEVTVNEEVTGIQYAAQVSLLPDGRVLYAWASADADVDGDSEGIAARVGTVQADGSIVWAAAGEFTVNEEIQSIQTAPQVTVLPDGRVVFVWQSLDPDVDGANLGIAARVGSVNADGSMNWSSEGEFTVNQSTVIEQYAPQVTMLADGRIVFTYQTHDPSVDGNSTAVVGRVVTLNELTDAQDDAFAVSQSSWIAGGNLFADNGDGADSDGDGDAFTVTGANGSTSVIGFQITLPSGALLTVNANGTFDYGAVLAFPNLLYGESAIDTFTYTIDDGFSGASTATVSITVNSGGQAFGGTGEVDNFSGGSYGDLIVGGARGDMLYGVGGRDQVYGGAGNDFLYGGNGDDILDGGLDADQLQGGDGADVMFGRSGIDAAWGDSGADTIYGGDGDDYLYGGGGNDLVDGLNHNDNLWGGVDNDVVYGRQGNDVLNGDEGLDTLYGGDGADQAHGGADNDLVDGGNGDDTLFGDDGDDVVYGRQDNDNLSGGAGADTLYGGDGSDTLSGGDGADTLEGGNGVDRLNGGLGADTLWGGTGADTYVFDTALGAGNIDTILYFSVAEDFIELSASIFGALAGDFFVIGATATSADHRVVYDAATGALYFDADGNGVGAAVQFATLSTGLLGLSESNFLGGP